MTRRIYRDNLFLIALISLSAVFVSFLIGTSNTLGTLIPFIFICILSLIFIAFLTKRHHGLLLELESERAYSASLSTELSTRIDKLRKLFEIGENLSGSLDSATITRRIIEDALALADADCGVLYLFDERGRIRVEKYEGIKRGVLYRCGKALKNLAMDQLEENATGFTMCRGSAEHIELLDQFPAIHIGSVLGVPILQDKGLKAVLLLIRFADRRDFNDDDLKLLSSLSSQASLALANSDFFGKTQKRLKEVSLLLKISTGRFAGRDSNNIVERAAHLFDELVPLKNRMVLERVMNSCQFVTRELEKDAPAETNPAHVILSSEEILEVELEPQRLSAAKEYVERFVPLFPADPDYRIVVFPIIVEENLSGFFLGQTDDESAVAMDFWLSTYLTVEQALSLIQRTRSYVQTSQLALLGEITASIAHSIRTPLTTLSSFAQMLLEKYEDPEFRQTFTRVLKEEIDRLNSLTSEILSYTGSERLDLQENSVIQIIERILVLVRKDLSTAQVTVEQKLSKDLPLIPCDANKIKELMLNVVVNAIQAMENGGTLTIGAELTEDGRFVEIMICDTGKGIPKGLQGKVFDPFFTTKKEGTGIGLMIAKRIVEQHGGHIRFDSNAGTGTCFRIDLPVSPEGENRIRVPDVSFPFDGDESRTLP